MYNIILLLLLLCSPTSSTRYICDEEGECENEILKCLPGEPCYIECSRNWSCRDTTIECPIDEECHVKCYYDGELDMVTNGQLICQGINIEAQHSTLLIINGSIGNQPNFPSPRTLERAVIHCPINKNEINGDKSCRIYCDGDDLMRGTTIMSIQGINNVFIESIHYSKSWCIRNTELKCTNDYSVSCSLTNQPPFNCQDVVDHQCQTIEITKTTTTTKPIFSSETDMNYTRNGAIPFRQINSNYYSLNGSNNNLQHPEYGMINKLFYRLNDEYKYLSFGDGYGSINNNLPNARLISNAIGQHSISQSLYGSYAPLSGISWVFSKVIDLEMCQTLKDFSYSGFYGINVPPCDWYWDNDCSNNVIMPFFRAKYDSSSIYRTPINGATSFIDLHYVYGKTKEESSNVRLFVDGLIKTEIYSSHSSDQLVSKLLNHLNGNDDNDFDSDLGLFYDANNNDNDISMAGLQSGIPGYSSNSCPMFAGENSKFGLITYLFKLEHNRIAKQLKQEFNNSDDEYLYQEARSRNIATLQHITYTEYLPIFLSYPIINDIIDYGYNSSINPTVSQWFCSIAHRYAHPATPNKIPFGGYHDINNNKKPIYGEYIDEIISSISIRDAVDYPCMAMDEIKNDYKNQSKNVYIESMLGGLMIEKENLVSTKHSQYLRSFVNHGLNKYITNDVLNGSIATQYIDLFALDIMRARDVGIPFYNDARELFGLSRITSWKQLTDNKRDIQILKKLYKDNINNLDTFVGAMLENVEAENKNTKIGSGHVGPLNAAILRDQYKRVAMGDRLFYAFNETLRNYTKGITLSSIIELNTNLKNLSSDVFTANSKNVMDVSSSTSSDKLEVIVLDGILSFDWKIDENNNVIDITFRLYCGDQCEYGWIGIGFGVGELMKGKDIIKMNFDQKKTETQEAFDIIDSYCPENKWIPQPDKSNDVNFISGSFDNKYVTISIQRALNIEPEKQDHDHPILKGETNFIIAYQLSSFNKHDTNHRTSGIIDWYSGDFTIYNDAKRLNKVKLYHGIVMMVFFGFFYPISAFIARYLKHCKWSRPKHILFGKLGMVTSMTSVYFAMSTVVERASTTHGKLGLVCCALLIFQIYLGQKMNLWLLTKKRGFNYIKLRYIHVFCACTLLGLSPITMWYGWLRIQPVDIPLLQYKIPIIWYSFIIFLIIIGESYRYIYPKLKRAKNSIKNNLDNINFHTYKWSEIGPKVISGSSWIIIHGLIYDITEWQNIHPGGRQILLHHIGTDCTRLFEGEQTLSSAHGKIRHFHSSHARKLMASMIVGRVEDNSLSDDDDDTDDDGNDIDIETKEREKLKIITLLNKQKITHHPPLSGRKIVLFQFDYNIRENNVKFINGDYILLHYADKTVMSRQYTPIHPKFILCNNIKNGTKQQLNRLFLMIRIYKKGKMSNILNNLSIGHTICITGPFMRNEPIIPINNNFNNTNTKRKIVLIAGGTGITPMFNVLQFLLDYDYEHGHKYKVYLIWCNRTIDDICFEKQLKYYKQHNMSRFWIDLIFDEVEIDEMDKQRLKWARIHTANSKKSQIVSMVTYFLKNGIPIKKIKKKSSLRNINKKTTKSLRNIHPLKKLFSSNKISLTYNSLSMPGELSDVEEEEENDTKIDITHHEEKDEEKNDEEYKQQNIELQGLNKNDRINISGPKGFVEIICDSIKSANMFKRVQIEDQLICLD